MAPESSPEFDLDAFNRRFRPNLPSVPEPEDQGAAENRRRAEEGMRARNPNPIGDHVFIGPRGGRYRINSKGRKSYDVP
jgi:hypothetical protein